MSFHQRSFKTRFGTMGDPAEAAFDLVYPKHHKLGLNRPPFFMGGMNLPMRYTPDRMLRDRFVECMGIGRDRLLKLKTEKVDALAVWTLIGPVDLFVFDQKLGTYHQAPIGDWQGHLEAHGNARTFENDKKPYIELHVDHFPSPPTLLPEEAHAA